MQTKFCKTCSSDVSVDLFTKNKSNSDGLDRMCKSCKSSHRKKFYDANKNQISERMKKRRLENPELFKEYGKRNYKNNKGKRIESVKEWQLKNQDLVKSYKSKNFENNKAKYKQNAKEIYLTDVGKEMHKIRVQRYNKTEKGKAVNVQKRNKRKHLMSNVEASFSSNDWKSCLNYFENSCAYCGCDSKLTQDHVIPVSKNGTYTIENILPSCKSCNSSKGNKDFESWYKTRPYYTDERFKKITNYILNTPNTKEVNYE